MLLFKVLLVPAFLGLVSLAGRRWGPGVSGWLAGLPFVAGPILFILATERGVAFAASSAAASEAAVFASVTFGVTYAHAARRLAWTGALAAALAAWAAAAFGLSLLPPSPWASSAAAATALGAAPWIFPRSGPALAGRAVGGVPQRMLAGAALALSVALGSGRMGPRWSGLFAVFPVMASVLAVFTHRGEGAAAAAALLRAMATGLCAFAAFCLTLAWSLPRLGTAAAFSLSAAGALAVQAATGRWLLPELPPAPHLTEIKP